MTAFRFKGKALLPDAVTSAFLASPEFVRLGLEAEHERTERAVSKAASLARMRESWWDGSSVPKRKRLR
jgi:hypothetical protein